MSTSAAPSPAERPAVPWKGAWGGAWLVVYGCAVLLKATLQVALIEVVVHGARCGDLALRVAAQQQDDGETLQSLGALVAELPAACGSSLRALFWADVGLSLAAVLIGLGVLRRSEIARHAALVLLGVEALFSIGVTVAWALLVLPLHDAWMARLADFVDLVHRAGGGGQPPIVGLLEFLHRNGLYSLASDMVGHIVHLTLLALLAVRLSGRDTRAWCVARDASS
jgi:hypothetical protein